MTTLKFQIGEALPAGDPVARFITVLGMMSNDWLRSTGDMMALDDGDTDAAARRVMLFRQQAALHHEAATFITESRRRFPEIDAFVNGLDQQARDECEQVEGGIDSKSPHYHGDWLADHRNVTFHYPEMHPEKAAHGHEEISEALKAAGELEGTITVDQTFGSARFRFADEVVVQWLPDAGTQTHLIEALRESVMALGRFAQRAAQALSRIATRRDIHRRVGTDRGGIERRACARWPGKRFRLWARRGCKLTHRRSLTQGRVWPGCERLHS